MKRSVYLVIGSFVACNPVEEGGEERADPVRQQDSGSSAELDAGRVPPIEEPDTPAPAETTVPAPAETISSDDPSAIGTDCTLGEPCKCDAGELTCVCTTNGCAVAECETDEDCSEGACVETWSREEDVCANAAEPTLRCTRADDPCVPGTGCADDPSLFCLFSDVEGRIACVPVCPG